MVPGAEVGALGEADPITEGHGGQVVDPGTFRQPAGLPHHKAPWELHAQSRLEAAARADVGPEGAQQPQAPAGAWQPARCQKGRAQAEPKQLQQQRCTGMPVGWGAIAIKLLDQGSTQLHKLWTLTTAEDPLIELMGLLGHLGPVVVGGHVGLAGGAHGGALGGTEGKQLLQGSG